MLSDTRKENLPKLEGFWFQLYRDSANVAFTILVFDQSRIQQFGCLLVMSLPNQIAVLGRIH